MYRLAMSMQYAQASTAQSASDAPPGLPYLPLARASSLGCRHAHAGAMRALDVQKHRGLPYPHRGIAPAPQPFAKSRGVHSKAEEAHQGTAGRAQQGAMHSRASHALACTFFGDPFRHRNRST